jgi:basic amino acid/polyamine antiporter, APA family
LFFLNLETNVHFQACEHTSAIHVVRVIGRWSLAALMVNIIIGSGIFGLPSKVASITGRQNLFSVYLAEFLPRMKEPLPRVAAITFLLVVLAAINVRGVKMGTGVSNFFTVSKLTPLIVFVLGGCMYLLLRGSPVPMVPESHDVNAWLNSILLVIFAYVGFEAALIPAGEAKNPDRDAPNAILAALGICTPVYALVQFVVVQTLANPAQSDRPLVAAAHVFGGPVLTTMIACGVLVSIVGFLAATMIATPRVLLAFAEQGDFPRWFAAVHPRYKTPYVSILVFAALVWALEMLGTFSWNAKLTAVSRLITYALTCAALPTLRWKNPGLAKFSLPFGPLFALIGISFCGIVLSRAGRVEVLVLGVTLIIALLNWIPVRGRSREDSEKSLVFDAFDAIEPRPSPAGPH